VEDICCGVARTGTLPAPVKFSLVVVIPEFNNGSSVAVDAG
jgi:hypothetical protein